MTLLEFGFPPPAKAWSTNQDRQFHHMERSQLIADWKGATLLHYRSYCNSLRIGYALPPGIVQVHIPVVDNRRRDPHNYCGTVLKAVIDGLVKAGAWPDDTPEWVGHREPILKPGRIVVVEISEKG